jgi:hypothetical protein
MGQCDMGYGEGKLYQIALCCDGVPLETGSKAAIDIKEELTHRPWHKNVQCEWNGGSLVLTAENDYDAHGLALMDEFSDATAACIDDGFDGGIRVLSIKEI